MKEQLVRRDVYSVLGGNMSFLRQALIDAGRFDERFSFGDEELDLCIRMRRAFPSGRIVFLPEARVGHHFKPSRRSMKPSLHDTLRRSWAYGRGFGTAVPQVAVHAANILSRPAPRHGDADGFGTSSPPRHGCTRHTALALSQGHPLCGCQSLRCEPTRRLRATRARRHTETSASLRGCGASVILFPTEARNPPGDRYSGRDRLGAVTVKALERSRQSTGRLRVTRPRPRTADSEPLSRL